MGYNRMSAVNYARAFWNRVCHDGQVATGYGYRQGVTKINGVTLTPGLPFSAIGKITLELDCTHFISCCVGQTHTIKVEDTWNEPRDPWVSLRDVNSAVGGGLDIPSPYAHLGVYGHDTTPVLISRLRQLGAKMIPNPDPGIERNDTNRGWYNWFWYWSNPETGDAIRKSLTPGDVLAWAGQANPDTYAHMALVVGSDAQIASHTWPRWYKDYTDVKAHPWVVLIKLP
jgi:hypothetical protein